MPDLDEDTPWGPALRALDHRLRERIAKLEKKVKKLKRKVKAPAPAAGDGLG